MKLVKVAKVWLAFSVFTFSTGMAAFADSGVGDVIVTLGENLTVEQKNNLLKEMNTNEKEATILYVSNKEEHDYLGKYMSVAQIGSKAISSSKITLEQKGYGLHVETKNINWVSEEMYKNALITAGVTDADIYVTAPFEVSGTGALTGLLKAYETSTDITISEEQKDVANEELVKTAELGDSIGDQNATDLMNLIKLKMEEANPQTKEEIKEVIDEASSQLEINLSENERQGLVDLFDKMQSLDIDWNAIGNQLNAAKDKFDQFINNPETQNWIAKIGDFFKSLVQAVFGFFKDLGSSAETE